MKLIGLTALARARKTTRFRLLTLLRATEDSTPHLRGNIIIHVGKAKKIWVNAAILEYLQDSERRELCSQIRELRSHIKQLEVRVDELEASRHAS